MLPSGVAAVYDRRGGTKACLNTTTYSLRIGGHRPPLQLHLTAGVTGKLAGGSGTGETFAARSAAAIDNGAAILRGHAREKAELADAALL
jgi:hypothetical protein